MFPDEHRISEFYPRPPRGEFQARPLHAESEQQDKDVALHIAIASLPLAGIILTVAVLALWTLG
jgi:hypothetical protein